MPRPSIIPLLLATLILAGCAEPTERPDGAADPDPRAIDDASADHAGHGSAGPRPEARTDTVWIEGMPETIGTRLYETGDDFPLPFSTYVPEDMAVEEEYEPAAVRFVAGFGGRRNDAAFLHMVVYPDTVEEAEALALLRGFEAGRGVPVGHGIEPLGGDREPPPIPWAIQAYRFRYQAGGDWFTGTAALGRHDGRLFHVIRHYPAEFGDGFGPRAALMLDRWRWADDRPLRTDGPAR